MIGYSQRLCGRCLVWVILCCGIVQTQRQDEILQSDRTASRQQQYNRIETLFDKLDQVVVGATGQEQLANRAAGLASKVVGQDYNGTKIRFIFENLLNKVERYNKSMHTVCEVGFGRGHSALLWLELLPTAAVYSFTIDSPDVHPGRQHLEKEYGKRFQLILGDSRETVPKFREENPEVICDVLLVDGIKTLFGRMRDVNNLAKMSTPDSIVYFDEVNSEACVRGFVHLDSVLCDHSWAGASLAYNALSKVGMLKIEQCVIVLAHDGICQGRLPFRGQHFMKAVKYVKHRLHKQAKNAKTGAT